MDQDLKWLDQYSGQTGSQLISLASEYRIDSLVVALEQAIDQKSAREGEDSLSDAERLVLAIEALEREVNNGGYGQFFLNSSREFAPTIADYLVRIGCPKTAEITRVATTALNIPVLRADSIESVMAEENEERDEQLASCDEAYYGAGEDIACQLFDFVKAHQQWFRL